MIRNDQNRSFSQEQFRSRLRLVLGALVLIAVALVARAVDLQLLDEGFLEGQGDARFTRVAKLSAIRGGIYDRNGEPLAASTPVDTVWVCPPQVMRAADQIPRLAEALNRDQKWLTQVITSNLDREFLYLVRHMRPSDAQQVKDLKIPGVYLLREYQRFYPAGEVTGHLLGFTKKYDDIGQEGLELAYDRWLGAQAGAKRVIQDRYGRTVEDVESIRAPRPGEDLITSIDLRIQYLAYRELKAAVQEQHAKGGSVVVLDVDTGEVLAMVNQPAYNPNDRDQVAASRYRNRAATDIYEPGSAIKPFIAAAGIASGRYHPDTIIDTSPGMVRVGIKSITDHNDLGAVPLTTVIAKSSNVGMTKMAMTLSPQSMHHMLRAFGFGEVTGSGFPGESAGLLYDASHWRKVEQATISYGYGLSVTPLQLARAYAILGAGGIRRPVTLRRVDGPVPGERVIDARVARELLQMMEGVVAQDGGTGARAALVGYRVAGKTGTAWTADAGGYSSDRYKASFGGVVPASHPRLAAIVVIDEPGGKLFYGGDVAAPVFANVMAGALRLLGVPPDGLDRVPATTLVQASRVP
ncbi:MAG TPA: penicillin-binding transpeptidase domain-containing protein [Steroidobacteraceae bacterium]|nr:penicillin-binding transpeptidase domain-containing protein [Steroidobacteraceae bacterium]